MKNCTYERKVWLNNSKFKLNQFQNLFCQGLQVTAESKVENQDKSVVFSYEISINEIKYIPPPKPPNMLLEV
jgi:hypothetical protein